MNFNNIIIIMLEIALGDEASKVFKKKAELICALLLVTFTIALWTR